MVRQIKGKYVTDAPRQARDENVIKTKIALFIGEQFTAERIGGELVIFELSDAEGIGQAVTRGVEDHGRITSVADLSRVARRQFGAR